MTVSRGVALVLALTAGPAAADGEFFQLDAARDSTSAVATVQRGDWSAGLAWNDYEGGRDITASLLRGFPVSLGGQSATVRAGAALRGKEDGETDLGLRLVAEHYRPTAFGALFLLGDYSTLDNSAFALVQASFSGSPLGVELSAGRSDADYRELTLAASYWFGDSPVSLRIGHRFEAEESFVGVSVNTF